MQQKLTLLRHPLTGELPAGFRQPRTTRGEIGPQPFYRIAGGAPDDPDPDDSDPDDDGDTPVYSKKDLTYRLTREKAQGERAATRKIMEDLGFDTMDEARAFMQEQRDAKDKAKTDAERAADEAKTEKEKATKERREAQQERRTTRIEAALIRAGVDQGDEEDDEDEGHLPDAVILLAKNLDEDATVEDIRAAAKKLKERLPALFGGETTESTVTKTKGHLPSGRPPKRKNPDGVKPGAAGRKAAERRGFIKSDDKD